MKYLQMQQAVTSVSPVSHQVATDLYLFILLFFTLQLDDFFFFFNGAFTLSQILPVSSPLKIKNKDGNAA